MDIIQIPYTPRPLQRALHDRCAQCRFLAVVCHRGFGKTYFGVNECLNTALDPSLEFPRALYLSPYRNQTKNVAWDLVKRFSACIPDVQFNESELRVDFPDAFGSGRIQLAGADNPDSLRGLHFDLVVLDEPAFMEPRVWPEMIRPTLTNRQGRAIFIGTPYGPNHFKELFDKAATAADWGRVCYPASASGVFSAEELASARDTMSEEQFAQELECAWSAVFHGSIYGKLLDAAQVEGRIGLVPANPGVLTHTGWDLGVGDSTAIVWVQRVGMRWAVVDYYEASGVGLSHYAKVVREKNYLYGSHIAPHDIQVQEFGSGKTRLEVARELGIDFTIAPRLPVDEGIDAVRRLLPQAWFDQGRCARLLEALHAYRRQWAEHLQMFTQRPVHDWASHGCDALRTFATAFQDQSATAAPIKVESEFDVGSSLGRSTIF
jgi:phage terminase large subunit